MDLAWDVDRDGDVSLVRCRVRNDDAVPRRVRIESRLDAPVLPPRRGGIPEDGWDESGVTLRLDPGERRALGFAACAPPAAPPVEVVEGDRVDPTAEPGATEPIERDERAASATADALRRLGDHRPPRDAVADGTDGICGADEVGGPDSKGDSADPNGSEADGTGEATDADVPGGEPAGPGSPPLEEPQAWFDAVESRLDAVETRIDRAERLTDADLATATETVAETDGVEGLSGLDERVAADAARLRELSERAEALAARAESTDAPIAALERLA